jgi:cell division protein FtsN
MLSARRPAPPRHEYRFGPQELVTCGAAFLLIWALTFVFGLLVGREFSGAVRGRAGEADPRGALAATAPGAERQPPGTPVRKPERGGSEDQLTFYKTLTAPTLDLPTTTAIAPKIEERIVPHEAAPAPPVPVAPVAPAGEPHPSPPAAPVVKSLNPRKPVHEAAVAPAPERRPPPAPAAATAPDLTAARPWTVQVSSFRSRALADELRGQLAAKGFDAYLVSVTTEEGRVRHRVRVGGFSTRAEAERVAGELRSERNLNPFVTTRSRG